MGTYSTSNMPANRDYPIPNDMLSPSISDVAEHLKHSSGEKRYLMPWSAAGIYVGIYVLALLAGTITIKTKIDNLRVEIGKMGKRHETALYYIVNNLPSEEFHPEEKTKIRRDLEKILKQ